MRAHVCLKGLRFASKSLDADTRSVHRSALNRRQSPWRVQCVRGTERGKRFACKSSYSPAIAGSRLVDSLRSRLPKGPRFASKSLDADTRSVHRSALNRPLFLRNQFQIASVLIQFLHQFQHFCFFQVRILKSFQYLFECSFEIGIAVAEFPSGRFEQLRCRNVVAQSKPLNQQSTKSVIRDFKSGAGSVGPVIKITQSLDKLEWRKARRLNKRTNGSVSSSKCHEYGQN